MRSTAIALALAVVAAGCPKGGSAPAPAPPAPQPDREPAPSASREFTIEDNHLVLPGPVVFTTDALDVAASQEALDHLLAFLEERSDVTRLRIEGHLDGEGTEEVVVASGARAWAVGEWLVGHGVDCTRLVIAGFGPYKPVADSSTVEGQARNSRIDVVVVALRGRNIDGLPDGGDAPMATPDACPGG